MEQMLEGYLDFAKGQKSEPSEQINLNNFLKEIIANHKKAFKGKIDLHLEEKNMELYIKPIAFKRALSNIISNAGKYAKNLWIEAGTRGKYIEINFNDDGPGISKEERENVFKPFYRLEKSRNKKTGGIGLGLSLTKDIINSQGGNITLSDSSYKGLKVTVRLPI